MLSKEQSISNLEQGLSQTKQILARVYGSWIETGIIHSVIGN